MTPKYRILIASVLALLVAQAPRSARAELNVVTTTTDLGWLASELGKDAVSVKTICKGRQDAHFVQAKPSFMVTLSRADLVLSVGLELEVGWLPSLIQGARNPNINPGKPGYFEVASSITPIDVPKGPIDRSKGDLHPFGNPHFWLDPVRFKTAAAAVAARMAELDPEHKAEFDKNLASLGARIDSALVGWSKRLAPYKGAPIVSYHQTFNYFHNRFGLKGTDYVEERPGVPPAPAHLARLITEMRRDGIKVIFHENYYDVATSKLVGSKAGAEVLVLPTSVGGEDNVKDYFQLIDRIVGAVETEMKKSANG